MTEGRNLPTFLPIEFVPCSVKDSTIKMKFFAPIFLALIVFVALFSSVNSEPEPEPEPEAYYRYGGRFGLSRGRFGRFRGGFGRFRGGFGRGGFGRFGGFGFGRRR